ncbi:MAG TPA: sulfotransferase [Aliidongia sp.]|uniref:sulfotransferase family protein n=1 Tax=Aliidongia sp. TaxID=1914230 RepID=UPI002DDCF382|nr:sulfotransferase [Aliidongia sp.]HEV2677090.1 sulfotransferase [Aliidongia sp.]
MENGIHFISGLPRSGSTLLAGILRQNPRFHAMMTSPLGSIYMAMQVAVSRKNEAAVFIDEAQKRALLSGVFPNYYGGIHREKVVFDTNRLWCTKLPALADHFPNAKIICCVRNISWIMDSIERLVRRNILDLSAIFGFDPGGTVYTRVNRLAVSDGMVGYALDALREAFFGEQADRLILVEYAALTRRPAETMARVYDFIGEAQFDHDFDHVEYSADEFDAPLGSPGLHTVRRKVEFIERPTILPPELFRRFEADAFWTNPESNIHNVAVVRHAE